jgi:hypothetical protein
MVVKKREVGDADQFAIIRAFTPVPRDASANFPDATARLPHVVRVCCRSSSGGPLARFAAAVHRSRYSSMTRPVFHDVIAASASSSAASPSSIVVLTGVPSRSASTKCAISAAYACR